MKTILHTTSASITLGFLLTGNPQDATATIVSSPTESALVTAIQSGGVVTFGFDGSIPITSKVSVTNNVILDGTGHSVTLDGGGTNQIMTISSGVFFSVTNLIFTHGKVTGANGIGSGTTSPQPGSPGCGGAIYSDGGFIYLTGCTLASNVAMGGLGATNSNFSTPYTNGGEGQGGAIFVKNGLLSLTGNTLLSNNAIGGIGASNYDSTRGIANIGSGGNVRGGAIYASNSTITIKDTVVSNNIALVAPPNAYAYGGAFYQEVCITLLSNVLALSNSAYANGFPYTFDNFGPLPVNGSGALGGAVAALSGSVTIIASTFQSNSAFAGGDAGNVASPGLGGAFYSEATVTITNSLFAGNSAITSGGATTAAPPSSGGAIHNLGMLSISATTLSANVVYGSVLGSGQDPNSGGKGGPASGGGLANFGICHMTNCTVALNQVFGGSITGPRQIPGDGYGGGIYTSNGIFFAMNVTVASNLAVPGPYYYPENQGVGLGASIYVDSGTATTVNTILTCPATNRNVYGTLIDGGHNICSDTSAAFTSGTSLGSTDPKVHALAYNGGPTPTMALDPLSPAVNTGTSSGAPVIDQRGDPRNFYAGYDIGAFEVENSDLIPTLSISQTINGISLSFPAYTNFSYEVQSTSNLATSNWFILTNYGPLTTNTTITFPIIDRQNSITEPGNIFRVRMH